MSNNDAGFVELAMRLARRGLGQTSPNPAVGAVLVREGEGPEIVGRGWTQPGGRPHAERMALDQAGERAKGTTLYVTLEPCAHQGITPPCAEAIIEAGVVRVACAMEDPDPRVLSRGFARLREAGIEVALGGDTDEAAWLAQGHVLRHRSERPFVQLKLAVGADGQVAPANGAPVWVTGEAARARGHVLRARADAILIGRGTAVADDPQLTCRLPGLEARSPVRVVLDSHLEVSPQARLFESVKAYGLWIFCSHRADWERAFELERRGARIFRTANVRDGRLDLNEVLAALAGEDVTRVLVEGGPTVAKAFVGAGLVDEAVFFIGSKSVGADGLLPLVDAGLEQLTHSSGFALDSERSIGADYMAVYRRRS